MYSPIDEPLGCSQSFFPIKNHTAMSHFSLFFLWLCCVELRILVLDQGSNLHLLQGKYKI